jgi:tetratricopeptide (TPR) repeat protein
VDHWRYVAGKLALSEGAYDEAMVRFEQVSPDAADALDAQFMIVNALRARATGASDPGARVRGAQTVVDAAERAIPLIESAITVETDDRRAALQYYVVRLRVFRAEALLDLGEPQKALDAVADVESAPGLDIGGLGAALRVRIDAYQSLGEPEKARDEIEHFLAAAPEGAGAVLGSMLAGTLAEIDTLLDEGRESEAIEKATLEGLPLAAIVEEWLGSSRGDESTALVDRVATVYRRANRFEDGLRLYDRLLRGNPDTVEVLFGRAECLFGLGPDRHAEAIGLYKRLAAGGLSVGNAIYWQSHLRVLDILDRAQRNTDKIVPRIKRLRMTDPELGGERYRRQFQRLESKYS